MKTTFLAPNSYFHDGLCAPLKCMMHPCLTHFWISESLGNEGSLCYSTLCEPIALKWMVPLTGSMWNLMAFPWQPSKVARMQLCVCAHLLWVQGCTINKLNSQSSPIHSLQGWMLHFLCSLPIVSNCPTLLVCFAPLHLTSTVMTTETRWQVLIN